MNKQAPSYQTKKEKELLGSAVKNPEVFNLLVDVHQEVFKSKYKKIHLIMKNYHDTHKTSMTQIDLAIELNKKKYKQYIKILNEDLSKKEILEMSLEGICDVIQNDFSDANIDNPVKIKKDIEYLKEENRKNNFKKQFTFLYKKAISERKLGEAKYTVDEIISSFIQLSKSEEVKNEKKDRVAIAQRKVANIDSDHKVLSTGYNNFDKILGGGFHNGNLGIVAARPSIGKTQFLVNIFYNAFMFKNNKPLFVFLEGLDDKIYDRLTVIHSQKDKKLDPIDNNDVKSTGLKKLKKSGQEDRYIKAVKSLNNTGINDYLVDSTGKSLFDEKGLKTLEMTIESKLLENPEIDSIIIDHIHQLIPKNNGNDFYKRVVRTLKGIASRHDIVVIGLAQLNRNLKHRNNKVPTMTDLRASGGIEEESDYIIFLHRDDYQSTRLTDEEKRDINFDTLQVYLSKHRDGEVGYVEFNYDKVKGIIEPQISGEAAKKLIEENPEYQKEFNKKAIRNAEEKVKNNEDEDEEFLKVVDELKEDCDESEKEYLDDLFA